MPNLDCKEEKRTGERPTTNTKGGPKGQKGKGKWKAAQSACLGSEEMDPENEEMPANEVDLASRFINLANIMGAGDWERKNWAKECSSIIETGFDGG